MIKELAFIMAGAAVSAVACAYNPSTERIEYREIVGEGDTVWGICAKVATDEDNLQELVDNVIRDNGIGMDCNIKPGQELVIRVERKHYFDFRN